MKIVISIQCNRSNFEGIVVVSLKWGKVVNSNFSLKMSRLWMLILCKICFCGCFRCLFNVSGMAIFIVKRKKGNI